MNSKLREIIIFTAAVVLLVVLLGQVPSQRLFYSLQGEAETLRAQPSEHSDSGQAYASTLPGSALTEPEPVQPSVKEDSQQGAVQSGNQGDTLTELTLEETDSIVAAGLPSLTPVRMAHAAFSVSPGVVGAAGIQSLTPSSYSEDYSEEKYTEEKYTEKQEVTISLEGVPSKEAFQALDQQVKTLSAQLAEEKKALERLASDSLEGVPSREAFQALEQQVEMLRTQLTEEKKALERFALEQSGSLDGVPSQEAFQFLEQQVEMLRTQLIEEKKALGRLTSERSSATDREAELKQTVHELEQESQALRIQLNQVREAQAGAPDKETLHRALRALEQDFQQEVKVLRSQVAKQQGALIGEVMTAQANAAANERALERALQDLEALGEDVKEVPSRKDFQVLEQEIKTVRTQVTEQEGKLAEVASAQADTVKDKEVVRQAVEALEQEVEAVNTQLAGSKEEATSRQDFQVIEQELKTLGSQLADQQGALDGLKTTKAKVAATAEGDEALKRAFQELEQGLKQDVKEEVEALREQLAKQDKKLAQLSTAQSDSIVGGGVQTPWPVRLAIVPLSMLKSAVGVLGKEPSLSSKEKSQKKTKAVSAVPAGEDELRSAWNAKAAKPADTSVVGGRLDSKGPVKLAQATFSTPPGVVGPPGARPSAYRDDDEEGIRIRPSIEKGGLLLRKGQWQIEPGITYSHSSKNRVGLTGFSVFDVIFIGEIRSEEIDRDIIVPSTSVRYGITDVLEAEAKFPMQYRRDEEFMGALEDRRQNTNDAFGLSDIEAGLYYHFGQAQGTRPHMIANMKIKAPTGETPMLGSGSWGLNSGLTMIKASDPVVLFSKLGYFLNFPADIMGNQANPGNAFQYGVGLAYALNYNLSLNAAFDQLFVSESTSNDIAIVGSRLTVANLKAGLTWALSKHLSLDFSVGAGLTEDSPDLTVSASMPYTF